MSLKVTILGCGNSSGVPAIGNYWGKCDPKEPRNKRSRSSILVQSDKTALVVDTGPDFREQINTTGITTIDGVLYTHPHGDHVHGIDDLRMIMRKNKSQVPCYGNKKTLDDLKKRFDYLFQGGGHVLYPPVIKPLELNKNHFGKVQQSGDIPFIPFEQDHGTCTSIGYRFGDIAYSVDMKTLYQSAIDTLSGIKIWIVDAAGYKSDDNPVHASLNDIYRLNEKIGAETVYLTSLSLGMDYKTLREELPNGYAAAYDGLIV